VSDTARERADLIAGAQAAIVGARAATGRHRLPGMLMMADIVDALLAERDELKRDLHFSETMHQADLDERVKIEKDCRALRERVAAAEKEFTKVHNDLGAESMRCE
jgi:hypothetical protein